MLDSDSIFCFEKDSTYITVSQMKFFTNRPNGKQLWRTKSAEFINYYNMCRVYNLVSEFLEEDERSAMIYWDEKSESVALAFPKGEPLDTAIHFMNRSSESPGYKKESDLE